MLLKEIFIEKDDPWEDIGYTRSPRKEEQNVPLVKKTRINLNVPFSQRESAKRAGARWDPGIRKWYIFSTIKDLDKIPSSWR